MANKILLPLFSLVLFIGCNEQNESPCKEIATNTGLEIPVIIGDFFSYHPITYRDLTYVSYVDEATINKKFSNVRPSHSFDFSDCEEAQVLANKDFNSSQPTILQYNGPGGWFPLKNDIYSQVLGIHIENTGCFLNAYAGCYNQRILTLIDDHFGYDMRQALDVLELQHRCLAIDINRDKAIKVDEMPTISEIGNVAIHDSDTIKCSTSGPLLGRFVGKVSRTGKAEIKNYLYGSLDCKCEEKMRKYFESLRWKPAIIDGDSIDSIVAFQFLN